MATGRLLQYFLNVVSKNITEVLQVQKWYVSFLMKGSLILCLLQNLWLWVDNI